MKLRALTLNAHKLLSPVARKNALLRLRENLASLEIDLLFLQEFRDEHPTLHDSSDGRSPLDRLGCDIFEHRIYAPNAQYDAGHHGNAILSCHPIHAWQNHDISNHRLERRGILHAEIEWQGERLHLLNTHFDLTQWGRNRQIGALSGFMETGLAATSPLLLAGDFNDWNNKVSQKLTGLGLHDAFEVLHESRPKTFPWFAPQLALDRLFMRHMRCVRLEVLNSSNWNGISDHLPLYGEFELVKQEKP